MRHRTNPKHREAKVTLLSGCRDSEGFTLIELMVVVVVVGVLATLALPKFAQMSRSAKEAEADLVLKEVYTLQQGYYDRYGRYATTGELDARGLPAELTDSDVANSSERYYYVEVTSPTAPGVQNTGFCAVARLTTRGSSHDLRIKSMGNSRIISPAESCA